MHRFEVCADRRAEATAVRALERAFTRMAEEGGWPLGRVEVGESDGDLLIRMDLAVDSWRRARRRGEEIFAHAWYDAFGERGARHRGRITDAGA